MQLGKAPVSLSVAPPAADASGAQDARDRVAVQPEPRGRGLLIPVGRLDCGEYPVQPSAPHDGPGSARAHAITSITVSINAWAAGAQRASP